MSVEKIFKVFFFLVGGLVIVNLLVLDFFFFTKKEEEKVLPQRPPIEEIIKPEREATKTAETCDPTCQDIIQKTVAWAIATLAAQPQKLQTPIPSPRRPFESYIPIGAGSTTSLDWTDISGAEVYVDTTKYGTIKEAYFEAGLRVPTANGSVCARIFNQTDKTFVFSSEVCSVSQKGERATSPRINLYSGNKLYRVQMKITMPYEGVLDFARIKLIWE